MAVPLEEFIDQLIRLELVPADALDRLFDAASKEQPLDTVDQTARALVRNKLLTAYQAEALRKGQAKKLVLGNYNIIDKLGEGGMGLVLKARHRRMDRIVALKVMSASVTRSPEALQRFHREVRAVARLSHPNIVHAYDADEHEGVHYFVMEYVEGTDLSTLVKQHGPLPVDMALTCVIQAARGLEYAHARGVIHRDIKPGNLLLATAALAAVGIDQAQSSAVKVLDMGLARLETGVGDGSLHADLTGTGTIMGTVDYMSPEQALETRSADARSDIYSLGCTLFYLLAGRPLFTGDTVMKRLLAHREQTAPSLAEAAAATAQAFADSAATSKRPLPSPAGVDAVFRKMVAKNPDDRYQTMSEVIAALQACLRGDANTSNSDSGEGTDLELRRFLAGLGDPATQTLTKSEFPAGHAATPPDTVRSGGLDETFHYSLTRRLRRSFRGRLAGRRAGWWIGGILACIAAVALFVVLRPPANDDPGPNEENGRRASANGGGKTAPANGNAAGGALTVTPDDEWVNLLARIDTTRDVPRVPVDGGIWERVAGGLRSPKRAFARIRVPLAARIGYQLRAEFTRLAGSDAVNFYLPVATRQVMFVVDGFGGGGLSGLQAVLKRNAPIPGETGVEKFRLENGKRYHITITVTANDNDAIIQVQLTGPAGFQFRWTGPIGDLSLIDPRFTLADTRLVGIGAWESIVDFHKLEFRALTDKATWTRSPEIGPAIGTPPNANAPYYALAFNGRSSFVEVPTLKLDAFPESQPLTIETLAIVKQPQTANLLSWLGKNWMALYHTAGQWGASRLSTSGPLLHYHDEPLPFGRKVHLAAVWDGQQFQLFVNGKRQTLKTSRFPLKPTNGGLFIGGVPLPRLTGHNEPRWFNGVLDEIHISRTARYRDDFVPRARFTPDKHTLALYHVDAGSGSLLIDSSDNKHHGTIHGATWVKPNGSPLDP